MASSLTPTISALADSTVLFSACRSATGASREIIARGLRGEIALFLSDLVIEEAERNLAAKAPAALLAFYIIRNALGQHPIVAPPPLVLRAASVVALKDAPIVAATAHANAAFLVTFDRRHLLAQKEAIRVEFGIEVLLPEVLLRRI